MPPVRREKGENRRQTLRSSMRYRKIATSEKRDRKEQKTNLEVVHEAQKDCHQ